MKTTRRPALFLSLILSALLAAGCSSMYGTNADGSKKTTGQVIDDATITSKVKTALLADSDVSGLKINVDTADGVVKLKGEVKTMALRKKAESIAKGVDGVKKVDNQLVITG
ncbi:MAG TPA: BON domain-containing protein [Noviherbaspirillum sp.]